MKRLFFRILLLFMVSLNVLFPEVVTAGVAGKTITFAFAQWRPLIYVDKDKAVKGLYADILSELFVKKLGYTVIYESYPWKRCQKYVESGEVDFAIMLPTAERLQYSEKSLDVFYGFYLNVFTYKNHPKLGRINSIKSAEDISRLGVIPATNLGNGWHAKNIDSYGVETRYVGREVELFKFLASRRADIVIDVLAPSLYLIEKQGLQDAIEVTDAQFGPVDLYLMMSKLSPHLELMPEINRAFGELKREGVIEKIATRYERISSSVAP